MASERSIKVTIVNRYYPNSVTGESAFELVNFLESNSAVIDVNSISVNSQYKGNKKSVKENEGNYYIPSFYHGNKKFFRLLANLYEGYSLIKKAKNINSDLVICLTDPPLVNFWAAILLKNNTPWILWSMDVYPDAFNAAGLVGENNFILRYLKRKIKKNSPNYLIALGDSQNSYLKNGFNDSIQNTFILPCGIHEEKSSKDKPVWYDESKITFAYAGNLGEAHSDRFLKNVIENLDPVKHQLILSVYGSKSSNIIRLIDNYSNVIKVDMLYKSEFSYIDIHLVSLLPEWTNICVPSKAVSAICSKSAVLFNGSTQSDTYRILNQASWFIPYSESNDKENEMISNLLTNLNKAVIHEKRDKAAELAKELVNNKSETFKKILDIIESF